MSILLSIIFYGLSGVFCFWLFYKCVNWFGKI